MNWGTAQDQAPVGGANDKDCLLAVHAVHLGQDLVQDAVRRAARIAHRRAALSGNAVQLVEEEYTGRALAGLVKNLTHLQSQGCKVYIAQNHCSTYLPGSLQIKYVLELQGGE